MEERIRFSANSSGETGYPPEKRKRNLTPISYHKKKKLFVRDHRSKYES